MMNDNEIHWCLGFFESQASFTVNIGLPKSKNRRYVVFKPYVVIANTDKHQVKYIQDLLELDKSRASKKKKKKEFHNETFSLNIQNFEDIDKILKVLDSYKFKSNIKQIRLDKFKVCYTHIKEIGNIHQSWDDKFESVILEKLDINKKRSNIDKNRFSASQWKQKIKEHLGE